MFFLEDINMSVMIIIYIIKCIIYGITINIIIENKGYEENWFFYGAIFGTLAIFVALSKPVNPTVYVTRGELSEEMKKLVDIYFDTEKNKSELDKWHCQCGRTNASYVGTCGCGRKRV